ncbi:MULTISPECIES: PTS mannose/fructose/sorbose/N-acetylgalactosamine transporter subunit IIC [unclassified Enterococcus]|uniref:PTS mannose/fructose/sorbose/N-acetylgalactosamine transporter subunit IIC n=1 Tax=unclassified Enterococcus TaxID=2608891 RepID=UPI000A3579C0|nr:MULTISPECIES: PTS sugar transporter subunit IIC [unclassified Enterococcus]OTO67604.1 PTS system sorbose-specific transporter subunit IIC [Enterococcus sp. 12E11_DIV0728]OUZ15542.1 PTS system sorbose-specific transporter subunit IIC [Enterococcus sp. 12F9_DIV0723]
MVAQALMLGLIAGIGILDGRIFGQMMFDRPLVTGLFVGVVLGDVTQGIIIGAQLELIWMGIAGIGAATPPDVVTGGILGTAFAIISGSGVEVALALAVPIAVLAQTLGVVVRIANTYFAHKADTYAKEANYRGLAISMWIPVCLFFLSTFLPTFLAILLGADQVSTLINSIPKVILDGMGVAGSLLPAIGFALLMDMLFSKKMAPFFFVGFLAAAYGGLNITAIALFAVCLAFILHFYIEPKKEATDSAQDNLTEGEIDFD